MTRNDGHLRGEESEMKVALKLIDSGCRVAYTYGHSHPYDLIADKDSSLLKIQVKTAKHEEKQRYAIRLYSDDKYDEADVDLFAGYVADRDEVFFVPSSEIKQRASVNYTPPSEMGSDANRERANLPEEYTFEAARNRL